MPNESFQHTEPTHVYRTANRPVTLLAVFGNVLVLIFIIFIYSRNADRLTSGPHPIIILSIVFNIVVISVTSLRHKLVISPAGVSITHRRTVATPWSNVVRLEEFHYRYLGLKMQLSCLVLYSPPLGHQRIIKHGIPAELRGRVIPILFKTWERPAEIEQDLQQYLPPPAAGGLFVPHSFAATPDPNEKRNAWLILGVGTAAIVTIATIVSVLF